MIHWKFSLQGKANQIQCFEEFTCKYLKFIAKLVNDNNKKCNSFMSFFFLKCHVFFIKLLAHMFNSFCALKGKGASHMSLPVGQIPWICHILCQTMKIHFLSATYCVAISVFLCYLISFAIPVTVRVTIWSEKQHSQ